jgi:hypothetical protein
MQRVVKGLKFIQILTKQMARFEDKNFLFVGPSMPKGHLCVNQLVPIHKWHLAAQLGVLTRLKSST